VWTELDDKEIRYGRWHSYTAENVLAEENKVHPPKPTEEIWPHWSEGTPTKLLLKVYSPMFSRKGVRHWPCEYYASLELKWNGIYMLSHLKENTQLLPGNYTAEEWSGVYRLFAPDKTIDRSCGKDPTGTLYIGCAGTGDGKWSCLHTRILSLVWQDHHAMQNRNDLIRQSYPWESLAVEWAYINGETFNHKGEPLPEPIRAERWLLSCYKDSYTVNFLY
jgi:hypothetical protein